MAKIDHLEKELQKQLEQEARKKGLDPTKLKDTTVQLDQQGKTIFVKWGEVEVSFPAPSGQTVDSWFDKYGAVIVGAIIALVGVAVGRKI